MKKISELKSILYAYIKEYIELETLEETMAYNISLYEEVIDCLNKFISGNYDEIISIGICLDTLFGNKYNDLLQYIYANKRLHSINLADSQLDNKIITLTDEIKQDYNKIKEKYDNVKKQILSKKDKMISARRTISSIKYSQIISKDDIKNIDSILRDYRINDSDISLVIEKLFIRNKNIISKQLGYRFEEKYKFINLLSLGYEKFQYPDVFDEKKLINISNVIVNILDNYSDNFSVNDYEKLFPVVGKDVSDIDEFEFVLIKILEAIREKLDEMIRLIKDRDFIMDLEIKNEIAADCYNLINKYNFVRNYMDSEIEKYNDEYAVVEQTSESDVNNLFYLNNDSGICYLISDIEKMPFEYLGKVMELLNDFKNNSISKKKNKRLTANSNAKGFSELKDDQIRIVYKKIKDNNYLIYGVFIKKDDRKYKVQLYSITNRIGIINEDSVKVEEELLNYVNENSRKWSR